MANDPGASPDRPIDIVSIGEPMVEFNQTRPGEPGYLQGVPGNIGGAESPARSFGGETYGDSSRSGADIHNREFRSPLAASDTGGAAVAQLQGGGHQDLCVGPRNQDPTVHKKIPAEKNIISVMTFIVLFPQLIAGPIVLYTHVRDELRSRTITLEGLERGMTVFIAGLAAKVLLANPLGALYQDILGTPTASAPAMWLATLASVLQLYFDFAGYSSMAIGMGQMMGFRFPQNFNHPLSARSMRDFWRRWHITLSAWLRDYVYVPLGGSRKGEGRTIFNLFIVWFLSGFWHGADWNHILWGLWFFVFISLERTRFGPFIEARPRLGLLYAQFVFFLSLPLFSYSSLAESGRHFARMFSPVFHTDILYYLRGNGVLLLIAMVFCAPSVFRVIQSLFEKHAALRVVAMGALMLLSMAAPVNEAYNPFIYFRF